MYTKYNRISIFLHWLIGLCVLGQITLGLWMISLPKSPPGLRANWFNIHKSIGMTLGILILFRVFWRITHLSPQLPKDLKNWEKNLAKSNHVLLYICMLIMPISGFLGSAFSKYPIQYFGYILPKFFEPNIVYKEILSQVHFGAMGILIFLICIHLLAVIKHQFINKDNLLGRMWFSKSVE